MTNLVISFGTMKDLTEAQDKNLISFIKDSLFCGATFISGKMKPYESEEPVSEFGTRLLFTYSFTLPSNLDKTDAMANGQALANVFLQIANDIANEGVNSDFFGINPSTFNVEVDLGDKMKSDYFSAPVVSAVYSIDNFITALNNIYNLGEVTNKNKAVLHQLKFAFGGISKKVFGRDIIDESNPFAETTSKVVKH